MSEEKLTNEQLHYYEAWKQQKATVTRLRGLLRRLEHPVLTEAGRYCFMCGSHELEDHDDDCEWKKEVSGG